MEGGKRESEKEEDGTKKSLSWWQWITGARSEQKQPLPLPRNSSQPRPGNQFEDNFPHLNPNRNQTAEFGYRIARRESIKESVSADEENRISEWASLQRGAWAGAVAGVIAETLMHPFDTISTRLKVQETLPGQKPHYNGLIGTTRVMIKEEGVRSLFGGVTATLLCALPGSAVYFGTYEYIKAVGINRVEKYSQESGGLDRDRALYLADMVHLSAGICAELATSVIVVPFEVIKSRMQIGSTAYSGALEGLYTIARTEGVAGLFSGYRACLLLDCSFSGVQFLIYERIRRDLKSNQENNLTPSENPVASGAVVTDTKELQELIDSMEDTAEDLFAGAVSGGLAAFLVNPFDVVAARLMTQNTPGWTNTHQHYKGTWDCLSTIARKEGVRGLWSGSLPRVLSIAPLSALTFGIYEKMKAFLKENDRISTS